MPASSVPRVRFAPSPTGFLHVGSCRTALFNWLFARRNGGVFLLRIEDTDTERNREEWVTGISDVLAWIGMDPDEEPIRQSARTARYEDAIDTLWDAGHLYACDCTREAVLARTASSATPGYDGFCRERGLPRVGNALRFRTPDAGETVVSDVVRGDVTFAHASMADFVVARSNGEPLFVLANSVDDRDMAITHVIRGEELLPSAPRGILIWRALDVAGDAGASARGGIPLPIWAHLPTLVNEARKKLSKRRDPVAVESYRDRGYLPEALVNYLALLGWSPPGDGEKVTVERMVETFALEDVNHSPAFFDVQKLGHMNGEYIRELELSVFVGRARPWTDPEGEAADGRWVPASVDPPPWPPSRYDESVFSRLAPLVQERVSTLGEIPALVDFVFCDEPIVDEESWQKVFGSDPSARTLLVLARSRYDEVTEWRAGVLYDVTVAIGDAVGKKLSRAQAPIRVAVTGRRVGPPLFESLEVLGRHQVLRRLDAALERLGSETPGTMGSSPERVPEPSGPPEPCS